ncbi:MAG TPA: 1-(5-phosphoribosyl)-5-[(5-phosphoribosylamino)methylideneamino]imidazole-4-carboxamide isomerase [Dehalococcoidia bacterium]|nr:1-(5-phosphoribosyl)-5-[(5-phosphoribosylamino)methylideneamino]imidazole-4-carboxamide isomerase [Dehalococcoidia bacterium]
MEIIPAIDIRGGRCVRLDQGDYDRETVYADDPSEVAARWREAGATRLHVVDLDGAREGTPRNENIVRRTIDNAGVPVQVGGGIRTVGTIDAYIRAGADRVALGTAAVKDQAMLVEAVERFGKRVFVGVDARDGMVATDGWLETSEMRAPDLVTRLAELSVRRIFYTDIGSDGMLGGPNFAAIEQIIEQVAHFSEPMAVIASGGVSSVEHVVRLKEAGVEGAIIGKALYTGAIDMGEALRAVS